MPATRRWSLGRPAGLYRRRSGGSATAHRQPSLTPSGRGLTGTADIPVRTTTACRGAPVADAVEAPVVPGAARRIVPPTLRRQRHGTPSAVADPERPRPNWDRGHSCPHDHCMPRRASRRCRRGAGGPFPAPTHRQPSPTLRGRGLTGTADTHVRSESACPAPVLCRRGAGGPWVGPPPDVVPLAKVCRNAAAEAAAVQPGRPWR